MNSGLEIAVQIFIRIEFRRVGGQIEHLNFVLVLSQPGFDEFGVMNAESVQDQNV